MPRDAKRTSRFALALDVAARRGDPPFVDELDDATRVIHAGSPLAAGAPAAAPLVMAATYNSAAIPEGYAYGREGNPTWEALEQALGALEGGEAVVFSSGQAAALALMFVLSDGRRRLVVPADGYYGTRLLTSKLARLVEVATVDLTDLAGLERELTGPSVLWAETPSNPLLRVCDLDALAALAAATGSAMVTDNTVATAVLQRPLEHGAVASHYSLTKAAAGHSDVVLGAVVTRDRDLLAGVRAWRHAAGSIPGPFEAWLALRGLRTLPLRIARQSETALAIARWLDDHPSVRAVHYPPVRPETRNLARRQMPRGFGPLLSFEVAGDAAAADAVVATARFIRPATSFGGFESAWERRARWASETAPEGLIRLSVGLEAPETLIADIDRALAVLARPGRTQAAAP